MLIYNMNQTAEIITNLNAKLDNATRSFPRRERDPPLLLYPKTARRTFFSCLSHALSCFFCLCSLEKRAASCGVARFEKREWCRIQEPTLRRFLYPTPRAEKGAPRSFRV